LWLSFVALRAFRSDNSQRRLSEDLLRTDRCTSTAVIFVLLTVPAIAQQPLTLKLWPRAAPGVNHTTGPETVMPADPSMNGSRGPITRITNVSDPALTVYPASSPDGAAMLVFPGGGYHHLAMNIEGTEICQWLNGNGITCLLVKYRVPQPNDNTRYQEPLQDAQRALGIVRLHAKEWNINPARIGAIGFSAGAHLAAALSNNYKQRSYPAVDDADQQNCRPDFTVLLYPGYLRREQTDSVAEEVKPTSETPPTFLVQAEDDPVHVENSLYYYLALKDARVPAEMHLYATGGHGYGMRGVHNPTAAAWPPLMLQWLKSIKMLP
jgi:acetyl esterase/lipase